MNIVTKITESEFIAQMESVKGIHNELTTFYDIDFTGWDFTKFGKELWALSFNNCILDNCNFSGITLKKCYFKECSIQDSDFNSCDLFINSYKDNFTGSNFQKCYLSGGLEYTNMSWCDMRDSEISSVLKSVRMSYALTDRMEADSLPKRTFASGTSLGTSEEHLEFTDFSGVV